MGLFFLISSTLTLEHLLNLLTILQQNGLLQVSEFFQLLIFQFLSL